MALIHLMIVTSLSHSFTYSCSFLSHNLSLSLSLCCPTICCCFNFNFVQCVICIDAFMSFALNCPASHKTRLKTIHHCSFIVSKNSLLCKIASHHRLETISTSHLNWKWCDLLTVNEYIFSLPPFDAVPLLMLLMIFNWHNQI